MLSAYLKIRPFFIVLLIALPLGCGGSDSNVADASVASDGGLTPDGGTLGVDSGGSTAKDTNAAADATSTDATAADGAMGSAPLTFYDDGVFRKGQPEAYLTNAILAPSNTLTISSALANNTGSIRIIVYQASGALAAGSYSCAPGGTQMQVSTVNPSKSFSAAQGSCKVELSRVSGRAVGTFTGSLKAPLETTAKVISEGQFDLPL